MKRRATAPHKQRGFTLVEMSITMAAAGLLFAAVTTGQELIDQAKADKLLNDVKSVEAQIQQFAKLKRRLPGDCNADGVIDYNAGINVAFVTAAPLATPAVVGVAGTSSRQDADNNSRANEYSYTVLLPTIPSDGDIASEESAACALWGGGSEQVTTGGITNADVEVSETNANVWINDLKAAGVISDSVPNRKFAKLVHEDFMFVGYVVDDGGASAAGAQYNAIVLHNVPQWMARRLSTAINGQDARADRSRLRLVNRDATNGTYDLRWQSLQAGTADTDAMRDGMVTVAYFFDRVPESKMETDIPG
ncbi:type II secretion system protein [Hydrogenophaga sp.]|uniref:type II secretion system protein n=1 Tax=Hydrogenophaga sp. TaxID=1904254 RepID=UPI003F6B3DAA